MVRVTTTDDPEDPLVLIVDNNPMGAMRLAQVFTQKGWRNEIIEDGDDAVDAYVRLRPDLVMLALDIPSLDGHIAALEMRESDPDARICFMAARHQRALASDATHSAGAVAWLQKPVTGGLVNESWDMIMGTIPEAVGLADLDTLYPADVDETRAHKSGEEVVDVGLAPLPALPALPLPAPMPAAQPAKKSGKGLFILLGVVLLGALGAFGYAAYIYLA